MLRVLIYHYTTDALLSIESLCREAGLNVVGATDDPDRIIQMVSSLRGDEKPDVIILDCLPIEIGRKVAERVRDIISREAAIVGVMIVMTSVEVGLKIGHAAFEIATPQGVLALRVFLHGLSLAEQVSPLSAFTGLGFKKE